MQTSVGVNSSRFANEPKSKSKSEIRGAKEKLSKRQASRNCCWPKVHQVRRSAQALGLVRFLGPQSHNSSIPPTGFPPILRPRCIFDPPPGANFLLHHQHFPINALLHRHSQPSKPLSSRASPAATTRVSHSMHGGVLPCFLSTKCRAWTANLEPGLTIGRMARRICLKLLLVLRLS